MKESSLLKHVMLAVGRGAVRVYRNNVGALKDDDDQWVRYGVCNPGGSDLIGWKSVVVTPEMVGKRVAVFVAIETKGERGRVSGDQAQFIACVNAAGGIAGVVRSVDEATDLLTRP